MSEHAREIMALWHRAQDSLAAAERLLADGFPDFAASRAYYAAFYVASALHLCAGKRFSKHSGVIAHVHKDYVKEGRLPADIGRLLNSLADLRDVGDYGAVTHVASADAGAAIADAKRFVEAVRPLLPAQL